MIMIIVTTTTTKTKPQVGTSTLRTADTIRHIAIAAAHDAKPAVIAGVVRSHARGGPVPTAAGAAVAASSLGGHPGRRGRRGPCGRLFWRYSLASRALSLSCAGAHSISSPL